MLAYCRTCRCSNGFWAVLHAMIKLGPKHSLLLPRTELRKKKNTESLWLWLVCSKQERQKDQRSVKTTKICILTVSHVWCLEYIFEGMFDGRWLNSSINGLFHDQIKANAFPILSWLSGFLFKSAEIPAELL